MTATYVRTTNRTFVRANPTNIKKQKVGNYILYERKKGEKRPCMGRKAHQFNVNDVDNQAAFKSMQQIAKMLYDKMAADYVVDGELTNTSIELGLTNLTDVHLHLLKEVREALDPSIDWDQPELLWKDPTRARYK